MLFGMKQKPQQPLSGHARMNDMKTTTRSAVPSGNGLMLPRLASTQPTATPVDKSAGGGARINLGEVAANL